MFVGLIRLSIAPKAKLVYDTVSTATGEPCSSPTTTSSPGRLAAKSGSRLAFQVFVRCQVIPAACSSCRMVSPLTRSQWYSAR